MSAIENIKQQMKAEGERVLISSRTVAEDFGKEHKHVLRDIEKAKCSEEFARSNFGPGSYTDANSQQRPEILMTKDGFAFIAMGFTGRAAAQFKELYIQAFNEMEATLTAHAIPMPESHDLMMDRIQVLAQGTVRNHERLRAIETAADGNVLSAVQQQKIASLITQRVTETSNDMADTLGKEFGKKVLGAVLFSLFSSEAKHFIPVGMKAQMKWKDTEARYFSAMVKRLDEVVFTEAEIRSRRLQNAAAWARRNGGRKWKRTS